MPKLKPNDEVLIYPYGGMHYHIKGCWMARTDMKHKEDNYVAVKVNIMEKLMTQYGHNYIPDLCVEYYEKGLPLPSNPMQGAKRIYPTRLKEK